MNTKLPYRQVHLDFHTSPHIEGIAAEFDPEEFAASLAGAHVNSVTCFARCHHGLIYYESAVHPERIHPHLARRNLLPEQIEALHKRGIRAPIYTTIQWDDFSAKEHQEWMLVNPDGRLFGLPPLEPGFYRWLDVFHPDYRQFLKDHVAELFRLMPVDGLFLDIVHVIPSLAGHWLEAMDKAGYNPEVPDDTIRFAQKVIDEWKLEMTEFIQNQPGYTDQCTIFYNAGHIGPGMHSSAGAYTHLELESLPGGGWGYLHFPVTQHFARGLNKPTIGMTGKFHTSWGDFGSYKNLAALEFECFRMLALGAGCSVGDQLHPTGRLDSFTYDLIGQVYERIEQAEPWCDGAEPMADIGVLTPEEFSPYGPRSWEAHLPDSILGAVRMLQEIHAQFNVLSTERDLSSYKLLILPDHIPFDPAFAGRLEAYLEAGGALIASYQSGLRPDGQGFALERFGVEYHGPAPYSPDFLIPGEVLQAAEGRLQPTGYVMYQQGLEVAPVENSRVLAQVEIPYFNRTWRHFSSHKHTPSSHKIAYPGIVQRGNVIYFSHPIFSMYQTNTPLWCRHLLKGAIQLLLPHPALEIWAPTTLLASLMQQPAEGRLILHLLHYIPERRGTAFDVVEEVIPLYNLEISLASERPVKSVTCVPKGERLSFEQEAGRVRFTLPRLEGYQIVEVGL